VGGRVAGTTAIRDVKVRVLTSGGVGALRTVGVLTTLAPWSEILGPTDGPVGAMVGSRAPTLMLGERMNPCALAAEAPKASSNANKTTQTILLRRLA
jgi:hypothetical protein